MIKFFPLLIVGFLITAGGASAQESFDEIKIGVSGHNFFNATSVMNSWESSKGLGLEISTPYHFGAFETGIRYVRFNELDFEDSGFHSTFVYVGWNYPYYASDDLALIPGFRVGTNFLTQDYDQFYDGLRFPRNESEFSFEITTRLDIRATDNLHIHVGVSYNRTLLNIPFAVIYGNLGLAYSFSTPGWLKTFLR